MTVNTQIRDMTTIDLSRVMEIENDSFVAPWKRENFIGEIEHNEFANPKVITLNNIVIGFIDYWVTFDSATLCQIAIDKAYRGNGLASLLMKELEDECYAKRVRNITLEVRKSNQIACNFYLKHGFSVVLEKPHYYSNGEDAIYMVKEVNLNG